MPLPSQKFGAVQCSAKSKRSGVRCLNNAVSTSNVCRMHGFVPKDKVQRNESHGMYRHGYRTLDNQKLTSEKIAELQMIESLAFALGIMIGKKTKGRKSTSYRKVSSLAEVKKL
jgi:hypothetical protein